jgi:hypothetical protein
MGFLAMGFLAMGFLATGIEGCFFAAPLTFKPRAHIYR